MTVERISPEVTSPSREYYGEVQKISRAVHDHFSGSHLIKPEEIGGVLPVLPGAGSVENALATVQYGRSAELRLDTYDEELVAAILLSAEKLAPEDVSGSQQKAKIARLLRAAQSGLHEKQGYQVVRRDESEAQIACTIHRAYKYTEDLMNPDLRHLVKESIKEADLVYTVPRRFIRFIGNIGLS